VGEIEIGGREAGQKEIDERRRRGKDEEKRRRRY